MASDEHMSDDYVAELLKKDAQAVAGKYARAGQYGLLPKRPIDSAPKLNTRFLRNVLKETDTHNAALKRREEEDAAKRLRELHRGPDTWSKQDEIRERSRNSTEKRGTKRRRGFEDDSYDDTSRHALERDREDGRRQSLRERKRDFDDREGHDNRYYRPRSELRVSTDSYKPIESRNSFHESSTDQERSRKQRQHKRRRSSGSRSRNHDRDRERRRSRSPVHYSSRSDRDIRTRTDERKRRYRLSRSPSSTSSDEKRHHRQHSNEQRRNRKDRRRETAPKELSFGEKLQRIREISPDSPIHLSDQDSDPLEALIGPIPPPAPPKIRVRGRGALAASSGIDARFSNSYDPTADVQPDDDDDWDQALESLRDRQRWRQQGAERLRAAGFTEDEVEKWQKGSEKAEDSLVWKKRGEGREWDRGKSLDVDGHVQTQPEWGRLKGT